MDSRNIALVLPPLLNLPGWSGDPLLGARLAVTLIPQALPLSIPAGLCIGVLWANRGYAATRRRLLIVLTLAFVCTGIVWVLLERVVPDANQIFRETMAAQLSGGRCRAAGAAYCAGNLVRMQNEGGTGI